MPHSMIFKNSRTGRVQPRTPNLQSGAHKKERTDRDESSYSQFVPS